MAGRSSFTQLCQGLALLSQPTRADLHIHTPFSDGQFSPAEVVRRAKLANLRSIAVTDHDTLAAIPELREAARPHGIDVIPGVEITTEFRGREVHLLAYFVDHENSVLVESLAELQRDRRDRLIEIVKRLRKSGVSIPDEIETKWLADASASLGRRHIAGYLVASGQVLNIHSAFQRYLGESNANIPTKKRMPIDEAITKVHDAGGITSWAHPPADCALADVEFLREMGLDALESEYPWPTSSRRRLIRSLAKSAGLAISGGSDCHGPTPVSRAIGSSGITSSELQVLRTRCEAYNNR